MADYLNESVWHKTKELLTDGLTGNRKLVLETVMENTRNMVLENATQNATTAGNISYVSNVVLPVLRRVLPTSITNEIIGVQPMTTQVGHINTLRMVYADSTPGAGVAGNIPAGTEALAPAQIAAWYSGNNNAAAPGPAHTAALEGMPGRQMIMQILRETVEAKTHRLSARWTTEAAFDSSNAHGVAMEEEFITALSAHITSEIDQGILRSLRRLPGAPTEIFDQALVSGTPTYVGDEFGALGLMILKQSNLIAQRTRAATGGNWVVLSATALTMLQAATKSAFQNAVEGTFEAPSNTRYVGKLNNSIRVFVDSYADDSTPIMVGYKGPGETQAAAYYCPYQPLVASAPMVDPNTFENVIGFSTRYGYIELSNKANSFGNAADYLGLIGINAANISFM